MDEVSERSRGIGAGLSSVCSASCPVKSVRTTETAVVEKPAAEDEHAGHHHGHAH